MIGEIEGIEPGQFFKNRKALHNANIHRGLMRGIAPHGNSIILSGGYIDDVDEGDTIIYTGEGGRSPKTGRQVADQTMTGGNLGLFNNYREGNPVRVSRGAQLHSDYAPKSGYRYDGLYRIESCWNETGSDGFLIWRYRLVKISSGQVIPSRISPSASPTGLPPSGNESPQRSSVYSTRIVRSSAVGNHVKALYDHKCQITGISLKTPSGPYAEACHIKPVGRPHNGPDTTDNILCLSPNAHVLFDFGAIALSDDLELIGIEMTQSLRFEHDLDLECIRYHREHIFKQL